MTSQALIEKLDQLGVQLVVNGDKLRFHPRDAMPAELLAELKKHKAALVMLLKVSAVIPGCEVVEGFPALVEAARDEPTWFTGCDVVIPDRVRDLCVRRDGWTASSWRERMLHQASCCCDDHPESALERRWACMLMVPRDLDGFVALTHKRLDDGWTPLIASAASAVDCIGLMLRTNATTATVAVSM